MSLRRSDFRHLERLRVRWSEVDMQKIVFNAHYLMYFDTAVAGYWRAMTLPYEETLAHFGGDLFVKKATLEYHGSARYDEGCEVGLRCARIGNSSLRFEAALFRGERLLVQGELIYVFADPTTQTSRPVPAQLRAWLESFEAGEPMLEVQTRDWSEAEAPSRALRERVFAQEQGIDSALLVDAADADALHALARNRMGVPVAAGRLLQPVGGPAGAVGRIGRMATRADLRGAGAGAAVLRALVDAARQRGDAAVELHAQATALGFYRREGFALVGDPYEEAGLPHQTMRMALRD
jgi:YbgC/YbaW family acyl-CoA thioester hydrolase